MVKTNDYLESGQVVLAMVLPFVNVDITPLVHSLVVVSHFGLACMLSVELIGYHPFPLTKKAVQTKNIAEEGTDL